MKIKQYAHTYFSNIIENSNETFKFRYSHLTSIFYMSLSWLFLYFSFFLIPKFGYGSDEFWFFVKLFTLPVGGFTLSLIVGKKYHANGILTFPTIGCFLAGAICVYQQHIHEAIPTLFTYFVAVGLFYATFISSIRDNLLLAISTAIVPNTLATQIDYLPTGLFPHNMMLVYLLCILDLIFSYRLDHYHRRFLKMQVKLEEEKNILEYAQEVAKLGNWQYHIAENKLVWSKQMYSIFPEDIQKGEPDIENHKKTIHADDLPFLEEITSRSMETDEPYKTQFRTFKEDLQTVVWVEARGQVLKSEKGEVIGLFGTCQDITEFKLLEELLEKEKLKMVQTAKLATLGEMSAEVAHEINNPITIIQGNAKLLRTEKFATNQEKRNKLLDKIEKNVKRVNKIVNGLRKFSRSSDGLVQKHFFLKDLFQEIEDLTLIKSKNTFVKIQFEMPENFEKIEIFGDDIHLEQIIINLVNNGADQHDGDDMAWVKVSFQETEDCHQIIVRDSGHGIPIDVRTKLFDPFYTTKDVGKGTGLGLSISKGVAQEHKGDLEYQLIEGHTAFVLSLPKIKKEIKKDAA